MINLLPQEMRKEERTLPKSADGDLKMSSPQEKVGVKKKKKGGLLAFFRRPKINTESQKIKEAEAENKLELPREKMILPQEGIVSPSYIEQGVIQPSIETEAKEEKKTVLGINSIENVPKETFIEEKKLNTSLEEVPLVAQVSLLGRQKVIIPSMTRERFLLLIALIIISSAVVGLIWAGLYWQSEQIKLRIHQVELESASLDSQIKNLLPTLSLAESLEQKAARANVLFKSHIYWTKFFQFLEEHTIPTVSYGDFSADVSGNIILNARAKDLLSVAKQLSVFLDAKDDIKELKISDISILPEGVYGFVITIDFVPGFFNK